MALPLPPRLTHGETLSRHTKAGARFHTGREPPYHKVLGICVVSLYLYLCLFVFVPSGGGNSSILWHQVLLLWKDGALVLERQDAEELGLPEELELLWGGEELKGLQFC